MARPPADFGLTRREAAFLRGLQPAWRIQRFLDSIDYDVKGEGCRSPRRVLRERMAQCMEARRPRGRVGHRMFQAGLVGRAT